MPRFGFSRACLLAYALTAGGAALPLPAQASDILIEGTGDGMDILQQLSRQFQAEQAQTRILIPPSIGSGPGIAKVASGAIALARSARPLTREETGQNLVATPVARIPSAILVHPQTGVRAITGKQLQGIFSGDITNWNEVGGPDLRIRVLTREEQDSTLNTLRATMPGWKTLRITSKARLVSTTTQEMVQAIANTPGAIGYAPHSLMYDSRLVTLAIDGLKPLDAQYPSATALLLVSRSGQTPPEAERFLAYTQTPAARETIRALGGVAP